MKRIFTTLFILAGLTLTTFSQEQNRSAFRSANMTADNFNVSLRNNDAGEILRTLLNTPNNHEFRIQTVRGTRNQTIEQDDLGFVRKRFIQYYRGIRVEHSDIRMHFFNDSLILINGDYINVPSIDMTIAISEQEAIQRSIEHIGARVHMWEDKAKNNWMRNIIDDEVISFYPRAELVISKNRMDPQDTMVYLAYKIDIFAKDPFRHDYVYVDAKTGKVLAVIPILLNVSATAQTRYSGTRTISTQRVGATYRLRDYSRGNGIRTRSARHSWDLTNTMSHAVDITNNSTNWTLNHANKSNGALDVHWDAMMTFDYFLHVHGRNSFDNNGGVIRSYVHVGTNWENAGWHTGFRFAFYGDGSTRFDKLTSLDVVAHEIGHGVTQFTADLVYAGESGALNESFSDIWAAAVQNYANQRYPNLNKQIWLIGDEINIDTNHRPLRNMSNPALSDPPQPGTFGGGPYWHGPNAGVHHNSGIMNRWFYLLSVGGTGTNDLGNSYSVTSIGISRAERIAYRAKSVYMTANTNFANARVHTIRAARDLYGVNSIEVVNVTNAWHAVGIGDRHPPFLFGPHTICFQENYIVASLPPNATVTWITPSNVTYTRLDNSTITVNRNMSQPTGPGLITATINLPNGSTIPFIKEVHIGYPNRIWTTTRYHLTHVAPSVAFVDHVLYTGFSVDANLHNMHVVEWRHVPNGNVTIHNILPAVNVPGETALVAAHFPDSNTVTQIQIRLWNQCGANPYWTAIEYLRPADPPPPPFCSVCFGLDPRCPICQDNPPCFCGMIGCPYCFVTFSPNPVSDVLTIDLSSKTQTETQTRTCSCCSSRATSDDAIFDIRLLNAHGVVVRQQRAQTGQIQFDVSQLPEGTYYLHIEHNGEIEKHQIIVQRN